jgi:hypothetical protein
MPSTKERLTERLAEAIADAAADHGTHDYIAQADAVLDIMGAIVLDAIDVGSRREGMPSHSVWFLIEQASPATRARAGGDALTELTKPTGSDLHKRERVEPTSQLSQRSQRSQRNPRARELTDPYDDVGARNDSVEIARMRAVVGLA